MNLLLDTHVLLWWLDDPSLLSEAAGPPFATEESTVYVSAATAWEIVIKKALGRLDAPDDLEGVLRASRFLPLSVTVAHAVTVQLLPGHHRDPFDRVLIAQAMVDGLTIVTRDANVLRIPCPTILGRAPQPVGD